jgi:hypothetical protein
VLGNAARNSTVPRARARGAMKRKVGRQNSFTAVLDAPERDTPFLMAR